MRTGPRVVYAHHIPSFRVIRTLPPRAVVVTYYGLGYHYYGGLYYGCYYEAYVIVSWPVGVIVKTLTEGYKEIVIGTNVYNYHRESFYVKNGESFKIIQPPLNTIVYNLPEEAGKVKINGEMYYQYNETLYKKIKIVGGKAFKVVGKNRK